MNNPIFVDSKLTGGHWAFKTERASRPFENPMDVNKKIQLRDSDVVSDIGAYVGEYSRYAVLHEAGKVLSYEATPETFEVLSLNKIDKMEIYNLAVVGDNRPTARLFLSSGIGVTNSIAKSSKKVGYIDVPAIRYEDAVRNSSVVKIDVEGAEYSYNIIQPQLRAIILEFHPIAKQPWREWAERIMNDIECAGYKPVVRPNFKSGWSLTGCWVK